MRIRSPSVRSSRSDMPPMSSPVSTRSGSSGSERAKDSRRRVKRGGAGRALHRIVEVHHHLPARAIEAAQGKIDAADDDREHVVEVVRDAAGQLADRLHLLHLAELGFGRFALRRFGLQRLVRFPQLLRALAHRLLELPRRARTRFRPGGGRRVLAQRLDGDDAEEDRAEADDDAEPAQIIGQLVGLGGEELALLDALGAAPAARRG